ncbi:MAG TPA: SigE family RNA polymerase sigma factor [Mycobacteriales bacterium]
MDAAREFDRYAATRWPALVRAAWFLTGDHDRAEDVAQAALMKTWRHWGRVRAADEPDRYVNRVLVNEFLRTRRRLVPRLVAEREAFVEGPEASVVTRDALTRALQAVPRGQRAVLVLRYWLDLSEHDTAAALGCSVGNVKSQAARGLARLREAYDGDAVAAGEERP